MAELINISLATTLSVIKLLEFEVKKLDKEIDKIMKGIPQNLTSIKGIGLVFSAGIIAVIADVGRFSHQNLLAKNAGLILNQNQSVEFEAEETSRMRTGNKYLRYYLVNRLMLYVNTMKNTKLSTKSSKMKFQAQAQKSTRPYCAKIGMVGFLCY